MGSFRPLNTSNSTKTNYSQVNDMVRQLNKEQVTKTFKQAGGKNAIINGQLPNGKYGQLLYDDTGKARILIGQHPLDGRMGVWVSKPGFDVLTELAA